MSSHAHDRNLRHLDDLKQRIPISLITTIDTVLRETAVFSMLMDDPRSVCLMHDIHASEGTLRRIVLDASGVLEDEWLDLEHACVSCAVREDAVPTLARLIADGRWSHVCLALPVTAESLPAARALAFEMQPRGALRDARICTVACIVDVATAAHDVFGDDTVSERGIALIEDDERSVGECFAAQIEHADLIVLGASTDQLSTDRLTGAGRGVVDALRAGDSTLLESLDEFSAATLRAPRHDPLAAEHRTHPLHAVSAAGRASAAHAGSAASPDTTASVVWTLELRSSLPLHPERLLENIERLGSGRLRSRGVFWVPNRPDTVCVWDGAGGQLSVGALDHWHNHHQSPRTHLVFTGMGDERGALRAAFEDCLVTAEEIADGGTQWLDREDVLAAWLGERGELERDELGLP